MRALWDGVTPDCNDFICGLNVVVLVNGDHLWSLGICTLVKHLQNFRSVEKFYNKDAWRSK